jgi:CubicO group peptidase (beta-lactamase class C family)
MNGEKLDAAVDAVARSGLEQRLTAGLVVRVERTGSEPFERAWGLALDWSGRRAPMTANAKFDVASITKIFTTTAALHLATNGKISLDATLCDIDATASMTEGRPLIAAAFRSITPRKLMTHSSGLHYWYPFYASEETGAAGAPPGQDRDARDSAGSVNSFADILERVLDRFPLAEGTIYSDLNYMLLGKIVERASGFPLKAAMRDLVCGPLKLADSGYKLERGPFAATEFGNLIERKMVGELGLVFPHWRPAGVPFQGEPDDGNCHYYFGDVAGHAGVFSTAKDLCALGRLYLDPASHGSYLSTALATEAGTDHGGGRGLGFQLGELYPEGGFGHSGFTGTHLYLNRGRGIVAAILANRLHVESPQNINNFRLEMVNAILSAM